MITNVSMSNFKPSFGLARLSQQGLEAASAFGYPSNGDTFLRADLFDKQKGRVKNTPISQVLGKGITLEQIAQDYGCSDNPVANADFIKNCILSKKGQKAIKNINPADRSLALACLWDKNYDNPELSAKDTRALLELLKEDIEPHIYIQNRGMLEDAK